MAEKGIYLTGPRVEVVCRRCGGYGVTVYPDPDPESVRVGRSETCGDCCGTGRLVVELWSGWVPDPKVLEMLATYEDA